MKLKVLNVELQEYGDNRGKYIGKMEYEWSRGNVELLLDDKISKALLGFIGPVISKFSHEACLQLENNLRQSLAEVEAGPVIENEEAV